MLLENVLYCCIGPVKRVREIFAHLEGTGAEDAFNMAKQKLTEYFEPQKIGC